MGDAEKSTVENKAQAVKSPATQEQMRNQQINFYIMRHMWQVIRKRAKAGEDDIYVALGISRARFTRVLDTGIIRLSKEELFNLKELTGIRPDVFVGKVCFVCSTLGTDTDAQTAPQTITEEEWVQLFDLRKARRTEHQVADQEQGKSADVQTAEEAYSQAEKAICEKLEQSNQTNTDNEDFYRLCYFLKFKKPASVKLIDDNVQRAVKVLKGLTFKTLDECSVAQLTALQKQLSDRSRLAQSIITYKTARDKRK